MVDRSKIGKRNRVAGNRFENKVCKTVAKHFNLDWKKAFSRAGAGHEQSHDAMTLDKYADLFPFFLEMKYREQWSLVRLFKDPLKSKIYEWYTIARDNTDSDLNPIMVFSKPYQPVLMITPYSVPEAITVMSINVDDGVDTILYVYKLDDFLRNF